MVKTLSIDKFGASSDSKIISEYLHQRGWMASIVVSKALADPKRRDSRKVTNLMDRLRDYALASGFAVRALAVKQDGFIKYWYPASRINTYLAALGVAPIQFDESKYGDFSYSWYNDFLMRGSKTIDTNYIKDSLRNHK